MNFLKSVKRQSFNRSHRKKARNGLYGHVHGPYESLPDNMFRYETLYAPNGKHYSQSKTPTVFFRKKSGRIKRLVKYKPIWAVIFVKNLNYLSTIFPKTFVLISNGYFQAVIFVSRVESFGLLKSSL